MLICCSNMTTRKRVLLLGGLVLLAALLPSVSAGQPAPLTPEIQVSGAPSTSQYLPSVAAEPDGGFVVAWLEGSNPSERTIRARRFTASGAAATEILRVSQTALPDLFEGPAVAVHAASGRFLVVWGAVEAVLGRVFDASGAPLTGEIEIHRYPQRGLFFPSVTASPDGFVVAWMMASSVSGSSAIFAHRYDSAGAPLGSELRVDAGTVSFAQKPMVAADSTGGFVVVWEQGSLQTRVAGRLFDPAGMPRTGELQLGEPVDVQAQNPSVAVAPDGGFFVIWERSRRVTDIVGRLFGADGAPRGPAARRTREAGTSPSGPSSALSSPPGAGGSTRPASRGDPSSSSAISSPGSPRESRRPSPPPGSSWRPGTACSARVRAASLPSASASPASPAATRAWSREAASPATRCAREGRRSRSPSMCCRGMGFCWATSTAISRTIPASTAPAPSPATSTTTARGRCT